MNPLPRKLKQALLYQLRDAVQQRPDALPHGPVGGPTNILELLERQRFRPPNKAVPGTPDFEEYYPAVERRST